MLGRIRSLRYGRHLVWLTPNAIEVVLMEIPPGTVGENYGPVQLLYINAAPESVVEWQLLGSTITSFSLTPDGILTGYPEAGGEIPISVSAFDPITGLTAFGLFTIRVEAPVSIQPIAAPNALSGTPWEYAFVPVGGLAPFRAFADSPVPEGYTFDQTTGILSTPVAPAGGGTFSAHIEDADGRVSAPFTISWQISSGVVITDVAFPDAIVGTPYSFTMHQQGAIDPFWAIYASGAVSGFWTYQNPATGEIYGTPAEATTYWLDIVCFDQTTGAYATKRIYITSNDSSVTPVITNSDLGYGVLGQNFSYDLECDPATEEVVFSLVAGQLPPGVSQPNPSTGVGSGTTNVAGLYTPTFRVALASDPTHYTDTQFSIRVASNPVMTPQLFSNRTVGDSFQPTFTATGGYGTLSFYLVAGDSLPVGSLNVTGVSTGGTLTTSGSRSWRIYCVDSQGRQSFPATYTLTTVADISVVGPATLNTINDGDPFSDAGGPIVLSGGDGPPYTVTVLQGPTGFDVDGTTGAFLNSASTPGDFTIEVEFEDTSGRTDRYGPVTLHINPLIVGITSPLTTLTAGQVNIPYSQLFTVVNASSVTNFRRTAGQDIAAAGLSFRVNSDTQLEIYGIPTAPLAAGSLTVAFDHSGGTYTHPAYVNGITIIDQPVVVTGDDFAFRTGSGASFPRTAGNGANIEQVVRFDTAYEVDGYNYQQRANLRHTTNPGIPMPTGQIGVAEFIVPARTGNHDIRGTPGNVVPFWDSSRNYEIAQLTDAPDYNEARRLNSRVRFQSTPGSEVNCYRSLHDNNLGNQPSGGTSSNAHWEYIGNYTSLYSGDTAVNFMRRLKRTHESTGSTYRTVSDFTEGDEGWVAWRTYFPRARARAKYLSNQQGGWKHGSLSNMYYHNDGYGQVFAETHRWQNYLGLVIRGGGPSGQDYWALADAEIPTGINWQFSGDYPLQPKIFRANASEHPVTRLSGGTIVVDPNSGTTLQQQRRRYGHLRSYTVGSQNPDSVNLPWWSDNDDGGILISRDCADRWASWMIHFKLGTDGVSDTLWEWYVAVDGQDWELLERVQNGRFYRFDRVGAQPGGNFLAYENPSIFDYSNLGYQAFWLTPADTARIMNSNQDPEADPFADLNFFLAELIVASGPIGICAPGKTSAPLSVSAENFIPATPGQVATVPTSLNGNNTPQSVCPADWLARTDGIGDGRKFWGPSAYSALCADHDNGIVFGVAMGGHACSLNDMIFSYETLGDADHPLGFRFWDASAAASVRGGQTSDNPGGISPYPILENGRIRSSHRYGGGVRVPDGRIFVAFGSPQNEGGERKRLLAWNPTTLAVTDYGTGNTGGSESPGFVTVGCLLVECRNYGVILMINRGDGIYAVFDYITNTWRTTWRSAQNANGRHIIASQSATASLLYWPGVTPRLSELLILGGQDAGTSGNSRRACTFNGSILTPLDTVTIADSTGVLTSVYDPALCRDPERGYAWGMVLNANTDSPQNNPDRGRLFKIIPGASNGQWTIIEVTSSLSGESIRQTASGSDWTLMPRGGSGRLLLWRGRDSFICFDGLWNERPKIIRKPA